MTGVDFDEDMIKVAAFPLFTHDCVVNGI